MGTFEKLVAMVISAKIPYEIIEHQEIRNVEEGLRIFKCEPKQVIKTLGFKADDKYIFFAVRGDKKLDFKKVLAVTGIARKNLNFIDPHELEDILCYEAGGLSPLHIDPSIKVYFDVSILETETVFCGMGLRNKTLRIDAKSLLDLSKGILSDIIQ